MPSLGQHFTLLHVPTTSGLISLLIVGLFAVPLEHPERLLALLAESFLMVGVASNYFDELRGRPWRTVISSKTLWLIGLGSYALSTGIGIFLSLSAGYWFLLFVVLWGFLVPCYSLELFGGRLHNALAVALNSGLSTLGCALLQVPTLNSSVLVVSMACGAIALYGRQHYELGKATGRDHRNDSVSLGFWQWLKLEVLVIDVIAIITLVVKFSSY